MIFSAKNNLQVHSDLVSSKAPRTNPGRNKDRLSIKLITRRGTALREPAFKRTGTGFSLLRGDCDPGDASANGRKPENGAWRPGVADG